MHLSRPNTIPFYFRLPFSKSVIDHLNLPIHIVRHPCFRFSMKGHLSSGLPWRSRCYNIPPFYPLLLSGSATSYPKAHRSSSTFILLLRRFLKNQVRYWSSGFIGHGLLSLPHRSQLGLRQKNIGLHIVSHVYFWRRFPSFLQLT